MRGFEPLTPWLQTRCSAGLSYIPVGAVMIRSDGSRPEAVTVRAFGMLARRGPVAQVVRAHP
jgi:hypothetical protein